MDGRHLIVIFELIDLEALGEKAVQDFTASLAHGAEGDAAPFEQAVGRLVAHVELTYRVAAKLAHREPTMEGTEAIWAKMVAICDQAAQEVKQLEQEFPALKASFDRILDFRNEAEKRRDLHG